MPNWKKIALSGSNPEFASLNVDNAVTASAFTGSFTGDGSGLTNVTIAEVATVSDTFTSVTSSTVTHNFGTKNVIVQVFDNSDNIIIPQSITTSTTSSVDIVLDSETTGRVVVAKGGHIISGSVDFNSLSNAPALLSSSAQIATDISGSSTSLSSSLASRVAANESFSSSISTTPITYTGSFVGDGTSLTGVTSYTDSDTLSYINSVGVISSSAQLEGFVSQSGNFVANETIIATGTNSVTSSNILALDTTNNYLGINQSSPEVTLHMTGDGAQTAQIRMEQYNDSSDAPDIRTRKARGTSASPAKNNAGDFIYRQNSERYNGSAYTTVGQFAVDSTGSADRFRLTLTVSEDGNTIDAAANQFMIDGNNGGAIKFNNSYYFPTSDGNANEVLTTDGSGTLTFSNPIPSGTVSSSAQITSLTSYTETFTGSAAVTASHNLGTKNVNVQCYGSDDFQFFPSSIKTHDTNNVYVSFNSSRTGRIIITK